VESNEGRVHGTCREQRVKEAVERGISA